MIYIANDHGGYPTKLKILDLFEKHQLEYEDLGTDSTDSVDYPDFAKKVAEKVLKNDGSVGVLICRTGLGMSMAVNRFKGIRGALCQNVRDARFARLHNNANVLVLSSHLCSCTRKKIIQTFLNTKYEGGRHDKRIQKMDKLG